MELMEQCSPLLQRVLTYLHDKKAKVYLVGGCVRDHLLGIRPKDFDIEVYGMREADLFAALNNLESVIWWASSLASINFSNCRKLILPCRVEKS